MSLTDDDLKALRSLMREEIDDAFEQRLEPFLNEVKERFSVGLFHAVKSQIRASNSRVGTHRAEIALDCQAALDEGERFGQFASRQV